MHARSPPLPPLPVVPLDAESELRPEMSWQPPQNAQRPIAVESPRTDLRCYARRAADAPVAERTRRRRAGARLRAPAGALVAEALAAVGDLLGALPLALRPRRAARAAQEGDRDRS